MALRGVNLPLAWVGQEKIILAVFREIGLNDMAICFWAGIAFLLWSIAVLTRSFGVPDIQGIWSCLASAVSMDRCYLYITQKFDSPIPESSSRRLPQPDLVRKLLSNQSLVINLTGLEHIVGGRGNAVCCS
jgi:hypothetical protein